ncbi:MULTISPECIES: hypothetical protein [unclassified Streptomyces]|uniref:helix-turn-helix transcriptional regulator n=1 Tax=unclassified Streptomyces TaxID=2593676 RepID=UPI0021CD0B0D|nr:hypothetical protein [Streptomyces sp. sk2.1]
MEDRSTRIACRPVGPRDVLSDLTGLSFARPGASGLTGASHLVEQHPARMAPESPAPAPDPFRRPQRHTPPCGLTDLPRYLSPVVEALLSGQTDETASRRLGISPRTYSRRVAELLEHLEVSTRFQGGAELIRRCQPGCPHRKVTIPQPRRTE